MSPKPAVISGSFKSESWLGLQLTLDQPDFFSGVGAPGRQDAPETAAQPHTGELILQGARGLERSSNQTLRIQALRPALFSSPIYTVFGHLRARCPSGADLDFPGCMMAQRYSQYPLPGAYVAPAVPSELPRS